MLNETENLKSRCSSSFGSRFSVPGNLSQKIGHLAIRKIIRNIENNEKLAINLKVTLHNFTNFLTIINSLLLTNKMLLKAIFIPYFLKLIFWTLFRDILGRFFFFFKISTFPARCDPIFRNRNTPYYPKM